MDPRIQEEEMVMKEGDTVFVIHRSQNVIEGVLGGKVAETQGFYTRRSAGHVIYFQSRTTVTIHTYSDDDIFSTKEAAKKAMFIRCLHYPRIRGAA